MCRDTGVVGVAWVVAQRMIAHHEGNLQRSEYGRQSPLEHQRERLVEIVICVVSHENSFRLSWCSQGCNIQMRELQRCGISQFGRTMSSCDRRAREADNEIRST
jgi:hypothetical protein